MENKKYYLCTNDYNETDTSIVGKAMTLSAWKKWTIQTKLTDFYDIGYLFDDNTMADIIEMVNLKEDDVIKYVREYWDIRIIPLEDSDIKFIDMDNREKLMSEQDVRKMCLELEQADLFNNFEDFRKGNLSIGVHFSNIEDCLHGDIDNVLEEIGNFGAWVKKIDFIG